MFLAHLSADPEGDDPGSARMHPAPYVMWGGPHLEPGDRRGNLRFGPCGIVCPEEYQVRCATAHPLFIQAGLPDLLVCKSYFKIGKPLPLPFT